MKHIGLNSLEFGCWAPWCRLRTCTGKALLSALRWKDGEGRVGWDEVGRHWEHCTQQGLFPCHMLLTRKKKEKKRMSFFFFMSNPNVTFNALGGGLGYNLLGKTACCEVRRTRVSLSITHYSRGWLHLPVTPALGTEAGWMLRAFWPISWTQITSLPSMNTLCLKAI